MFHSYEIIKLDHSAGQLCVFGWNNETHDTYRLHLDDKVEKITKRNATWKSSFIAPPHYFLKKFKCTPENLTNVVRDYETWVDHRINTLVVAGMKDIFLAYLSDLSFYENKKKNRMEAEARICFWGEIPLEKVDEKEKRKRSRRAA